MKNIGRMGLWYLLFSMLLVSCHAEPNFTGTKRKAYEATAVYKNSFVSSEILNGSQALTADGRYGTDNIVMRENPATTVARSQIVRTQRQVIKKQGHDSRYSREEFDVSSAGLLDLLVVIDDSNSMSEEQMALGRKLDPLLSEVTDTNWQIAVISMSNPMVNSSNLVKKGDTNAGKKFENAVKKPSDPRATEQGFPMAIQSLDLRTPWIREGSAIGVLIVSDEDNCGSDAGELARCKNIQGKNADEMLSFLQKLRPNGDSRVYALVKQDAATCPNAAGVGTEYLKAVAASGGVSGSICAGDYSPALTNISQNVNRVVRREFRLSGTPDMLDFKVEADGVPVAIADAWSVSGKTVTINPDLFKTAKKISFTYSHDAEPKFDSLPVAWSVAQGTLVVKYNGVEQSESAYVLNQHDHLLTFTPQPPEDVLVQVTWREDRDLLKRFTLPGEEIRKETLEVSINGVKISSKEYDFDGKNIDFHVAPLDGSLIGSKFKTEQDKILSYQVAFKKEPIAVAAVDSSSGELLSAQREGSILKFDRGDFYAGRAVKVDIDYGAKPTDTEMILPETARKDSIKVTLDGEDRGCVSNIAVLIDDESVPLATLLLGPESKVMIQCPADTADYTLLELSYQYETPRTNEFEVPQTVPLGDRLHPTGWRVFVNGVETKKFYQVERKITIEESELGAASKVDIEATTWAIVE